MLEFLRLFFLGTTSFCMALLSQEDPAAARSFPLLEERRCGELYYVGRRLPDCSPFGL